MRTAFLSLGSNMGPRERTMEKKIGELDGLLSPPVLRSRLMETEPLEVEEEQAWYVNCIVAGGFGGQARELLLTCRRIEESLGRTRGRVHGPRTADIDILLLGDMVVDEPDLVIPHPGMLVRRFCVEGLAQIAPALSPPGLHTTIGRYREEMDEEIRRQRLRFLE
jgi:2-amino-4-hydroxy-6-hydroxymethyldihydropteridine diphosphokinase